MLTFAGMILSCPGHVTDQRIFEKNIAKNEIQKKVFPKMN